MNARVVTGVPNLAAVDIPAILLRVAQKHAPLALAAVQAKWPVESGTSRAGWDVDVVVEGRHAVRIVLRNPVPYAKYVTAAGSRSPLAETLAGRAIREAQAAMNAEVAREIATALRNAPRRMR